MVVLVAIDGSIARIAVIHRRQATDDQMERADILMVCRYSFVSRFHPASERTLKAWPAMRFKLSRLPGKLGFKFCW